MLERVYLGAQRVSGDLLRDANRSSSARRRNRTEVQGDDSWRAAIFLSSRRTAFHGFSRLSFRGMEWKVKPNLI